MTTVKILKLFDSISINFIITELTNQKQKLLVWNSLNIQIKTNF